MKHLLQNKNQKTFTKYEQLNKNEFFVVSEILFICFPEISKRY